MITHHAPILRSLAQNPHAGHHLDAAYANEWLYLMDGEPVAAWVHGHSHTVVDYYKAGTRIVYNPQRIPKREHRLRSRSNRSPLRSSNCVQCPRCHADAALGSSLKFSQAVTAYLTAARIAVRCCLGVANSDISADPVLGWFTDGHRIENRSSAERHVLRALHA